MTIDFVVPGFSKCGTTTLCDMLNSHSEIFIPKGKEPGYFAENFHRGWEWYLQGLSPRRGEQLAGDGSTTYSSQEFAALACQRILDHSPECKFIFIARDPKKRLESSFREMHASAYKYGISPSFKFGRALRQLPNMIADTMYWKLINIFRSLVPDDRIHVLFLQDLRQHSVHEYERCLAFLGVPAEPLPNRRLQLNPASSKVCDTRLLRFVRTHPLASRLWGRLSPDTQESLIARLRLRRPFNTRIVWDDYALDIFERVIAPDARQFLTNYGKPLEFWNLQTKDSSKENRAA